MSHPQESSPNRLKASEVPDFEEGDILYVMSAPVAGLAYYLRPCNHGGHWVQNIVDEKGGGGPAVLVLSGCIENRGKKPLGEVMRELAQEAQMASQSGIIVTGPEGVPGMGPRPYRPGG
jgi:hypothetical protein